jgi:7,8-dihydropterin-6-yl-methyl-4-(beta-D-ribofuranosyl)aminobenzene 5'-phosphate synthase
MKEGGKQMNPIKIGEVDKVTITTLVDDNSGFNSQFLGHHGLSLLIEITSGDIRKKILLDTGQSEKAILFNSRHLNIDLNTIDMIILSHCHYDHTGGLIGILKEIGREIPVIAHPAIFRQTYSVDPYLRSIGMPLENTKENIRQHGGHLLLTDKPLNIMKGVISTGEVERSTDFENKGINTFNIRENRISHDDLIDDLSIIINIRNKGILVISGCSHAGIINILKHTVKITGIKDVYGVVGGLHLLNSSDLIIDKTIESLSNMNIQLVAAGHCTGLNGQYKLSKAFDKGYQMLHSGKKLEITSK